MRSFLLALTLALLALAEPALAEPDATTPPAAASVDAAPPTSPIVPGSPSIDPEAPEPSTDEIVDAGKAAFEAGRTAAGSKTGPAILAAVSAAIWFLILAARRWGGVLLSKQSVRIVSVFGGALAAALGLLSLGLPWQQAIELFLAGPGAIALNEILRMFGIEVSKPKQA